MMPAHLLQISYGSATHELDNKTIFTNLLRVHNSNSRVTTNIVKLLEAMNDNNQANINAVVIVTTDTGYGKSGRQV